MTGILRFASWTLALLFLGTVASPAAAAGDDTRRTYAGGAFALELQGAPAGFLRAASGGDAEGQVVTTGGGSSTVSNKHIASVRISDLVLEVGAGMEPAVYDWIAKAWDQKNERVSGAVVLADYNFNVMARREFQDALITETSLPALDASSKEPAFLTVKLAPELVRLSKAGGTVPSTLAAKQRPWLCSNFRLEIPGLDCARVKKIDPFRVGNKVTADNAGEERGRRLEPAAFSVSDLVITMPESSAETWRDWAQSFLVEGKNDDGQEKSGELVLLGTDLSEIARVHLSGLGIQSLRQEKAETANAIRNVVVTLYCERAALEWKGGTGAVMNVRVFGR
jgi:hypothetical protein